VTDVRFTVLGRIAIEVDGTDVRIPGRRERAVLALLLAARRSVVPVGRLIDDIWGESPADSAQASLQVAVSRLRALVEPDRAPRATPRLLVSSGAGYALIAGAGEVDAEAFAGLVDAAHDALESGGADTALDLCERADRIWAGTPFGDVVESDLVTAERRRLEDLHAGCFELRAEAQLALGRHALVTGELEGLVAAYPFRERLWRHYALALYRSARQAEALDALRRARTLLREELGVDPSPELRQLEADLLTQAPELAGPPAGARVRASRTERVEPEQSGLVGRENALDQLRRSIARTVDDGQGHTVVVSGEAGIGKSRLLTELADGAEQYGARVLWGHCHEADVSPAYWPWVPIVQALAGAHPSPEIVELLDASAGTAATDAGAAALRRYDAVSRLVSAAAQERPIVLLLEDVHWADSASLQLLSYAAETLRGTPVLLAATLRTGDAPSEPLQACLASLSRSSADRIVLDGLPTDQVRRLVGRLTESEVDDELAAVVAERTDGNPFFVIELVRLLDARSRLDAAGAREVDVPHGVQDVLRLRLARLPDPVRTLLGVAAVAGRGFQLDLLAEVASRTPEETLDLLDAAVASHAVEEGDLPGRYRFTHALVRETLYGSMSLARRGLLHAAIAQALEPQLAADADLVAEVAHHFVLGAAMRPQLAGPAVRHSITAARHAEGRGALDQALVHWEQALTADTAARDQDPRRRYDVLLGLGQARHRRADVAGSREALGAAMDIARDLADQELVATAATSFRGAGVWHWREFGTSDPAMVSVLEDCIGGCSPGPLRTRVLVSLAMELVYEWRSVEAEAVGWRAVETARKLDDDELFADVVALHTLALWGKPGAVKPRLDLAEQALALPLSQERELYLRFGAAAAHLQAGNTLEADRQMARCTELSRRLRHTGADVPIAWWRFYRAIDADDAVAGERLLGEAVERHRLSSIVAISDMEPMARFRLGDSGHVLADAHLAAARRHANPAFRAMIGHALADAGRAQEGAELLGEPVPDGAWDYASTYGDCLRVDVLAAAGLTDRLPAALARIQPWGHEFAIFGSTDCIGSIDYFVGRGLEGLGDVEAARAAYARAGEANRAAGIVPWQRRAERRLAGLADHPVALSADLSGEPPR
jgi:DNA-binding SARP family transcriptional activator